MAHNIYVRVEECKRKQITREKVRLHGKFDETDLDDVKNSIDSTDLNSEKVGEMSEVMFYVNGQIEGISSGIFLATNGDSQGKYRHMVAGIRHGSLLSKIELMKYDEILVFNGQRVDKHPQHHVLHLFKTVLSASTTQTFSLMIRRPNLGGESTGEDDLYFLMEISIRVEVLVTVSAARASNQQTQIGKLIFNRHITGNDKHTEKVLLHLKLKYDTKYIGFDSHNRVKTTPRKGKKNRFSRTTFVAYDGKSRRFVFVVSLQMTARPNDFLAAIGGQVKLMEYKTMPNPYESVNHQERYFIIRRIGDRDLYESVSNRGFYISYTKAGLALKAHKWSDERPADSIIFQQVYDTNNDPPPITSGRGSERTPSVFSAFFSTIFETFENAHRAK